MLCNSSFSDSGYTDPDDERAVKEAEKALHQLGDARGAVSIGGNSVDIIGLKSMSYSGVSVEIDRALKDLGARKVGQEIQVSLSGDVLFDFDKWDIKQEAEATLHKLAKVIKGLNKRNVIIEGHTDSKGSAAYNLKLSQKRATSVKNHFIAREDLKKVDFSVKAFGEERPVAPNTNPDGSDNPEGRAKNRRVEIRIRN